MRDKVTGQCPQTTTFEEKGEPKRIRTEVPLGCLATVLGFNRDWIAVQLPAEAILLPQPAEHTVSQNHGAALHAGHRPGRHG